MRALLYQLAVEAERTGWRPAVLALLSGRPDLLRYVGDERAGDWRFLLPELPRRDALCVGGALSAVPLVLARTCERVTVQCGATAGRFLLARAREEGLSNVCVVADSRSARRGPYDLVALLRSPLRAGRWRKIPLPELARHVSMHGSLYVEVDSPALLAPPAALRRNLARSGLPDVSFYWPKPTFGRCEMLMPVGNGRDDLPIQRYYLDYQFFAMSAPRRALRAALKLLLAAGLFHLTVPEYAALARRAGRGSA